MLNCSFIGHLSVGAQADSAHEYLLKQYLLTAKTDKASLEMCKPSFSLFPAGLAQMWTNLLDIRATTHILTNLFYVSPTRHLLYVTDTINDNHSPSHTLEHLSCFLPGLLALGAHTLPLDDLASMDIDFEDLAKHLDADSKADYAKMSSYNLRDVHLWAAEGLAQTCYLTYADQPSGLGPDEVVVFLTPNSKKPYTRITGELWFDTLEAWRKNGARGSPPGLAQREPVQYTEKERLHGPAKGKPVQDYFLRKTGYLLRPEVCQNFPRFFHLIYLRIATDFRITLHPVARHW